VKKKYMGRDFKYMPSRFYKFIYGINLTKLIVFIYFS